MPNQITRGQAVAGKVRTKALDVRGANERNEKWVKVALAAVDTAGGLFAWKNPEGTAILVTRTVLDVTTQSTSACTADVGTAADGVTSNDGLINGVSLATAGVLDNLGNAGTNGKARQRVASGAYVTGSVASGASAGLVGSALIAYVVL